MRIGLVCPYSWDVPGGVQAHVRDLAEALLDMGHDVSVLAPADEDTVLQPYVVGAGRSVPIPYNGSVARLQFGVLSAARVRRWIRNGHFDVLHIHEPESPSLSLLACMLARGPIVATFHAARTRYRSLAVFEPVLQPFLEKIGGRIAVSAAARKVQVEHFGGDAVEIPNGVAVDHFARAEPLPGYPRRGGTLGFIGRFDEPRKGMRVLVRALELLLPSRPHLRLLVVGRGDQKAFLDSVPPGVADHIELLGMVNESDKARMLRSIDIYCASNIGGESFGIILLEAMAAGTAIAASDLEAFRRVLEDGRAGGLFATGDGAAMATVLARLLDDQDYRKTLVNAGQKLVIAYDWKVVAEQVVRVYETVTAGEHAWVTAEGSSA